MTKEPGGPGPARPHAPTFPSARRHARRRHRAADPGGAAERDLDLGASTTSWRETLVGDLVRASINSMRSRAYPSCGTTRSGTRVRGCGRRPRLALQQHRRRGHRDRHVRPGAAEGARTRRRLRLAGRSPTEGEPGCCRCDLLDTGARAADSPTAATASADADRRVPGEPWFLVDRAVRRSPARPGTSPPRIAAAANPRARVTAGTDRPDRRAPLIDSGIALDAPPPARRAAAGRLHAAGAPYVAWSPPLPGGSILANLCCRSGCAGPGRGHRRHQLAFRRTIGAATGAALHSPQREADRMKSDSCPTSPTSSGPR